MGSTENFKSRLALHNTGQVKSTRLEKPWKRVFIQNFSTLTATRKRELQVKHWKSRKAIERLVKTSHF